MARYSVKDRDEVPSKDSDKAQRRTKPADLAPRSPKQIDALYAKYKESIPAKEWLHYDHQANQFVEDRHQDHGRYGNYHNDVPTQGERSWLRGGQDGGESYPCYDKTMLKAHQHKLPTGNKASGQDMHKSPFSSAHRKGAGEGFVQGRREGSMKGK